MNTILLTSLLIALFCAGLRIISSRGMIFHFLRWPYERLITKINIRKSIMNTQDSLISENNVVILKFTEADMLEKKEIKKLNELREQNEDLDYQMANGKDKLRAFSILLYILKPIIGCGVCMASAWTIVYFAVFDLSMNETMFLVMFIVAAFNGLILGAFELMTSAMKFFKNKTYVSGQEMFIGTTIYDDKGEKAEQ